jgi:hypothetical protein
MTHRRRRARLWLLALLVSGLALVWRTGPVVEGVWAVKLVGGCQVEVYSPMQQGQWTAVWACPGQEMTRLWPWPVEFPWFERDRLPPYPTRKV